MVNIFEIYLAHMLEMAIRLIAEIHRNRAARTPRCALLSRKSPSLAFNCASCRSGLPLGKACICKKITGNSSAECCQNSMCGWSDTSYILQQKAG